MTKIIQITDPHLVPPGGALFDTDPEMRLRGCLRDIAANYAQGVEYLIFTGDLAHRGSPDAYALLARILEEETVLPWRLTLGNHDDRDNFRAAFPDHPVDAHGFAQSVIDLDADRLILLDTLEPGTHSGRLCDRRLGWLSDRLAERPGVPVHLFLHHPPFRIGMDLVDDIRLLEEGALAELLTSSPGVRHMAFGHVHRAVAGSWRGIPISMSYGLNHQAGLNLDGRHRNGRIGPAEYAIFLIEPDRTIVHFHDYLYAYPEVVSPGMGSRVPVPASGGSD